MVSVELIIPLILSFLHATSAIDDHNILFAKNTDSLSFLIHGDWGSNGFNQSLTAYEMGVYAWLIDAKFVVALGDNFYNDGIQSTYDSLWQTAFHDIYTSSYLKIPWYPVLGNHDYNGNVDMQVKRTLIDQGMWTMPSRYYAFNYSLPDGGSVCIVYIDTCLLNPEAMGTQSLLNDRDWRQKKQEHLEWIDNALSQHNETSTWLVVAGHYPIYSIGEHGDDSYLISDLLPILKRNKVHIYMSGHDHNHQHIVKDGMHFIVSGGSAGRSPLGPHGLQHYGVSAATADVKHYHLTCGFGFAEVDSSFFNITFVDNLGRIRYTAVLDDPHNVDATITSFGNGLPGLGVSANATSAILLVPAIIIAIGIMIYLSQIKYNPVNMASIRDGGRIRLDVVEGSTHSNMGLNPSGSMGGSRRGRLAEYRV